MPVPESYPAKVTKADFIAVAAAVNDLEGGGPYAGHWTIQARRDSGGWEYATTPHAQVLYDGSVAHRWTTVIGAGRQLRLAVVANGCAGRVTGAELTVQRVQDDTGALIGSPWTGSATVYDLTVDLDGTSGSASHLFVFDENEDDDTDHSSETYGHSIAAGGLYIITADVYVEALP